MVDSSKFFVVKSPDALFRVFDGVDTVDEWVDRIFVLSNATGVRARSSDPKETALYQGVSSFFSSSSSSSSLGSFVASVVGSAMDLCDEHESFGHDALFPSQPARWKCSRSRCRGILANALLGNMVGDPMASHKPRAHLGSGLNLVQMYQSQEASASQKVQCLLQYMQSTDNMTPTQKNEIVVFDRISLSMKQFCNQQHHWKTNCSTSDMVEITTNAMEHASAHAVVNFANRVFGVGHFGSSCSQEEILQVCCPEINVGMLVHGHMPEDTVVVVRNPKRYVRYTGYGRTFRYDGPDNDVIQSIVFMDASVNAGSARSQQFTQEQNLRDIRKAYLGFALSAMPPSKWKTRNEWLLHPTTTTTGSSHLISTGKWGCGVFGGDPVLKFLQQTVAAMLCRSGDPPLVSICFSSYRDQALKDILENVLDAAKGLTPNEILPILSKPELFEEGTGYEKLMQQLKAKRRSQLTGARRMKNPFRRK